MPPAPTETVGAFISSAVLVSLLVKLDELPGKYKDELRAYLMHGEEPSPLVRALVSNDVVGTLTRANAADYYPIFQLCIFLAKEAPSEAAGSPEAYAAWIARGGAMGPRHSAPRAEAA